MYVELLQCTFWFEIVFFIAMVITLLIAGKNKLNRETREYDRKRMKIPMWAILVIIAASFVPIVNLVVYLTVTIIYWCDSDGLRDDCEIVSKIAEFLSKEV